MSEASHVTFEKGYRRLQEISERVNSEEVPVHEMCDLFAEGKGLALALGGYLDQQKARVEAIERGEGIKAFRVVPPGEEGAREAAPEAGSEAAPATEELPF